MGRDRSLGKSILLGWQMIGEQTLNPRWPGEVCTRGWTCGHALQVRETVASLRAPPPRRGRASELGTRAPRRMWPCVWAEGLGTQGRGGPGASTPSQQAVLTISWTSRSVLASGRPHNDPHPLSPGLRQVAGNARGSETFPGGLGERPWRGRSYAQILTTAGAASSGQENSPKRPAG